MIKMKGGFTLIEVSLFLAITGLLFLGVTIGVQNSVFQQRYNDSVQNFVEFLRSAYAKTENVQSAGTGNTEQAIYGKLITFGEKGSFENSNSNPEEKVFMYDVIGLAKCGSGFNGTLDALKNCGAKVVENGMTESYKPKWSAAIQTTNSERLEPFKGAILITRHPQSGTIYTFSMIGETLEVNQNNKSDNLLNQALVSNKFKSRQVDFCLNPNGYDNMGEMRTDVRIKEGARNTAGIEVMPDSDNDCLGKGN